jgi:hypothetical protein
MNLVTSFFHSAHLYQEVAAFVFGLYAWWRESKLANSKKILVAVIKGVEFATSLPEVQEMETKVKGTIAAQAQALGVSQDLDKIVQNVTTTVNKP